MKTSLPICFIVLLFGINTAIAQTGIQRRFNHSLLLDTPLATKEAPRKSSPDEASLYFDEYGEWRLEGATGAAFDTNAFEDPSNLSDWRWEYGLALTYDWWVNEATGLVISPSVGMEGERFDRYDELSGDVLATGLSFTFLNLPVNTEVGYTHAWGFESGFGQNHSEEDAFELKAGDYFFGGEDGFPGGGSLLWELVGGYVGVSPEPLSYVTGGGAIELEKPLSDRITLVLGVGIQYQQFTRAEFAGRSAWFTSASTDLSWQIHDNAALVAGVGYFHSDDEAPDADYDQFVTTLSLEVGWDGFSFLGLPISR